jgi:hypothetical protein
MEVLNWLKCINFRILYEDRLRNLHTLIGKRSLENEEFKCWYNGEHKWLWCHGMREYTYLERGRVRQYLHVGADV